MYEVVKTFAWTCVAEKNETILAKACPDDFQADKDPKEVWVRRQAYPQVRDNREDQCLKEAQGEIHEEHRNVV